MAASLVETVYRLSGCVSCVLLLTAEGAPAANGRGDGSAFPPTSRSTGMRNAAGVASLFLDIGSEEEGAWE